MANLELNKGAGELEVNPGGTIDYTVVFYNFGPDPAAHDRCTPPTCRPCSRFYATFACGPDCRACPIFITLPLRTA